MESKKRLVLLTQNLLANRWVILVLSLWLVAGCSGTGYKWVANTLSTPPSPNFDPAVLTKEPIAIVPVLTPGRFQGYGPVFSPSLWYVIKQSSPAIKAISSQETLNRLNREGLGSDFNQLVEDWKSSGNQDRMRLKTIGSALGVNFLLIPGMVHFDRTVRERVDLAGLAAIHTEIMMLGFSMQIWNTATGELLWQSVGQGHMRRDDIMETRFNIGIVSRDLWWGMIEDLKHGKTSSHHWGVNPGSVSVRSEID